jgi:FixJ family two-component response regulator
MIDAKPIVFVVDDDPSVRKSLGRVLKTAGYQAQIFTTALEFLRRSTHPGPACLVLDLQLPDLNGLELQQMMAGTSHSLPIVFISGHSDIPTSVRAMKNGAVDFLTKPFQTQDLLRVIDEALTRSAREQHDQLENASFQQRLAQLTPRESDVLSGVIAGKLNKQIAAELGVGEKTVKVHRGRMMEKLGVHSVAELVRAAERSNAVSTPV